MADESGKRGDLGRVAAVLAALACITGCGPRVPPTQAMAARYVYHHPADEVRGAIQTVLREQGFVLVPTDDGPFLHTQWKRVIDDDQFASTRVRYVVLVKRLTAEHSRIEAVRIVMNTMGMETYHPLSTNNPSKSGSADTKNYGTGLAPLASVPRTYARDFAFEWQIVQRVDPAAARRMANEAARGAQ